jgi:hypothetical protein
LDGDDGLSLVQPFLQPRVLPSQLFILGGKGIARKRLFASLLGFLSCDLSRLALSAPIGEVRRIQALTPQKSRNPAGPTLVSLVQDVPLVFGGETPSYGFAIDFRIGKVGSLPRRRRCGDGCPFVP